MAVQDSKGLIRGIVANLRFRIFIWIANEIKC